VESVVLPAGGTPRTYTPEKGSDNRGAFGAALEDLGAFSAEAKGKGGVPMAVLDCDLLKSTKTDLFAAKYPKSFYQGGIAEHHTGVLLGALSLAGVAAWWGEFGMFGVAEAYNQQRLNDVNETNAKLAVTHSGIDVGEDGKTHHSIDYFGLLNSTFGWKVFTPADPNQTDRITRWMATHRGNHALVMGRSKVAVQASRSCVPATCSRTGWTRGARSQRTGRASTSSPSPRGATSRTTTSASWRETASSSRWKITTRRRASGRSCRRASTTSASRRAS
jgi:transketolase